jgi:hypothetical protein
MGLGFGQCFGFLGLQEPWVSQAGRGTGHKVAAALHIY